MLCHWAPTSTRSSGTPSYGIPRRNGCDRPLQHTFLTNLSAEDRGDLLRTVRGKFEEYGEKELAEQLPVTLHEASREARVKRENKFGLTVLRCLLSPFTSWRVLQIMRNDRESISFDVAWRRARLRRHRDEAC